MYFLLIRMNYQETLEYMYAQLPMFTRVGAAAYKADLNNTIELCKHLNNPHFKFRSIHIAGTNGKGSCSNMLAAIFSSAGYKTGLYTSPHITDFRERIRIDGVEVEQEFVVNFIEKNRIFIEILNPSFFEITVAMAFDYFAQNEVDIAIIEVGLGGLLDSTNVIIPEVSVITNISLDHTNLLGNSLASIALQKAGIMKENVPTIIGETQPEIQNLFFTQAVKHKCQLYYADEIFEILSCSNTGRMQEMKILHKGTFEMISINLSLAGSYQMKNIKTVLTVCEVMQNKGWEISRESLLDGLKNVQSLTGFRGRFDVIKTSPCVILDVSHNEAGLKEVFAQVERMKFERMYIVLAFAQDKNLDKVLNLLPKNASYFATQAQIPRALPYLQLHELLLNIGLDSEAIEDVALSLKRVEQSIMPEDLLLITGSFFIMDEAYGYFA